MKQTNFFLGETETPHKLQERKLRFTFKYITKMIAKGGELVLVSNKSIIIDEYYMQCLVQINSLSLYFVYFPLFSPRWISWILFIFLHIQGL